MEPKTKDNEVKTRIKLLQTALEEAETKLDKAYADLINPLLNERASLIREVYEKVLAEKKDLEAEYEVESKKSDKLTAEHNANYEAAQADLQKKEKEFKAFVDKYSKMSAKEQAQARDTLKTMESAYLSSKETFEHMSKPPTIGRSVETARLGEIDKRLYDVGFQKEYYIEKELKDLAKIYKSRLNQPSEELQAKYPELIERVKSIDAKLSELNDSELISTRTTLKELQVFKEKLEVSVVESSQTRQLTPIEVDSLEYGVSADEFHSGVPYGIKAKLTFNEKGELDWTQKENYVALTHPSISRIAVLLCPESLKTLPVEAMKSFDRPDARFFDLYEQAVSPKTYEKADKEKYPTFESWKEALMKVKHDKELELKAYQIARRESIVELAKKKGKTDIRLSVNDDDPPNLLIMDDVEARKKELEAKFDAEAPERESKELKAGHYIEFIEAKNKARRGIPDRAYFEILHEWKIDVNERKARILKELMEKETQNKGKTPKLGDSMWSTDGSEKGQSGLANSKNNE